MKKTDVKRYFGLLEKKDTSGIGSQIYSQVNHQIMHNVLGRDPKIEWNQDPYSEK